MRPVPRWSIVVVIVLAVCLTALMNGPIQAAMFNSSPPSPLSPLVFLPMLGRDFPPHHHLYLPVLLN